MWAGLIMMFTGFTWIYSSIPVQVTQVGGQVRPGKVLNGCYNIQV